MKKLDKNMKSVEEVYDENSKNYVNSIRDPHLHYLLEYSIIKNISISREYGDNCLLGMNILDLACGSGSPTITMLSKRASKVIGLDISAAMLTEAESLFSRKCCDKKFYDFKKANCFSYSDLIQTLPLDIYENSFDAITGIYFLCYAETEKQLIECFSACNKFLKPNGKMAFITHNPKLITDFERYRAATRNLTGKNLSLRLVDGIYVTDVGLSTQDDINTIKFVVQNRIFENEMIQRAMEICGFSFNYKFLELNPDYFEEFTIYQLSTPGQDGNYILFEGIKIEDNNYFNIN